MTYLNKLTRYALILTAGRDVTVKFWYRRKLVSVSGVLHFKDGYFLVEAGNTRIRFEDCLRFDTSDLLNPTIHL